MTKFRLIQSLLKSISVISSEPLFFAVGCSTRQQESPVLKELTIVNLLQLLQHLFERVICLAKLTTQGWRNSLDHVSEGPRDVLPPNLPL